MSDTGVSFQARMAMAAAAARRLTFAGSRLVSVPPCLRPIEEEESDAATAGSSSSCDEMSFSNDELSTSNDDGDDVSQVATPTRHFDHVSSTAVSFHDSKHFEMCLMCYFKIHVLTLVSLSSIVISFSSVVLPQGRYNFKKHFSYGIIYCVIFTFTFAICHRPSVCLSVVCLSVTFVRPTQAIEIFGNIFTPFGTLAIC